MNWKPAGAGHHNLIVDGEIVASVKKSGVKGPRGGNQWWQLTVRGKEQDTKFETLGVAKGFAERKI